MIKPGKAWLNDFMPLPGRFYIDGRLPNLLSKYINNLMAKF